MKPLSRLIVPAFLLLSGLALPSGAQNAGKSSQIDTRAIVTFVTGPDENGKKYVAEGVDRGPLEAVIRAYLSAADGATVEELDVAVRSSLFKPGMRRQMSKWAVDGGQIKPVGTKDAAEAFMNEASANAHKLILAVDGSGGAIPPAGAPTIPDSRQTVDRARRLRESQRGDRNVFGPDKKPEDGQPGTGGPAGGGTTGQGGGGTPNGGVDSQPKSAADIQALADELNAAEKVRLAQGGVKLNAGGLPSPVEFQSLGSLEVAPAAGTLDKAASFYRSDSATIAQDQATIRAGVQDLDTTQLPQAINDGNSGAIQEFFRWLQSAKPEDMPSIDYAILPAGEVGHYELGLLSKGSIVLNHFIRNAEPRARSAVLVHELYHYWDKKIAKNPYPNVSYGYIDPNNKHIHEYDAYLATAQYWAIVGREGDNSPLARMLGRIPAKAEGVKTLVNGIAGK